MRAVVDSSTWISLARSGLLPIVGRAPVEPVVLDVVRAECVRGGLAGGHADAAVIETLFAGMETESTTGTTGSTDETVLGAARRVGALVTNDLALGRRARTLGLLWLRTADLVVWSVRAGNLSAEEGRRAITALRAAGRLADELAQDYIEELP